MSKRVAISVVVLILGVFAHPGLAQNVEVGAKLGPAITSFGGDADADSKTGFAIVAFLGYRISDLFGVYPELSFVSKGANWTRTDFLQDPLTGNLLELELRRTADLDYLRLTLPVALLIPISKQLIGARVFVGPSLSLEVSCQAEARLTETELSPSGENLGTTSETVSLPCEGDPNLFVTFPTTNTIDVGLLFGAGVEVRLGPGMVSGDVRYDLGLTDITEFAPTVKNRSIEILLGYTYAL